MMSSPGAEPDARETPKQPMNLPALSPKKKARLAFASALTLLLISGTAATITIVQLLTSAKWIAHTYDVQVQLGDIQSAFSAAARARTEYLNSGNPDRIQDYEVAKTALNKQLFFLRQLPSDTPPQQALVNKLEDLGLRRLELLDPSIELRRSGPLDESPQLRLSRQNVGAATDFM